MSPRAASVKRRRDIPAGSVVAMQWRSGGEVVDLIGTMTRTRCLGCDLSAKPHWHAEEAKPSASNRAARFVMEQARIAKPGPTTTIGISKLVGAAAPLAEILADGESDPASDVRVGRQGLRQRSDARRLGTEKREKAALMRDGKWAAILSAVGLLPLDAPSSIKEAAAQLERSRADGWHGALAVLKKRRNVKGSALYSPKKQAAESPVKRNLRSSGSRANDRKTPSIKGGVDTRRGDHRSKKEKH